MDTIGRAKWSLTGIGFFGAVVAAMIGVPGFVDDLEAWKATIDRARLSNIDWTIWFLIAFGFVLVAAGPWVLPNIYLRLRSWRTGERGTPTITAPDDPATTANSGDLADLQEVSRKLQEALDENERLTAERDEARFERDREGGDKETLAKEITQLGLTVRNREETLRDAYWKLRFGHERPIIPDLPLPEAEAIRLRTQELKPALGKATGQFETLFLELLGKMRSREEQSGLPWLGGFIGEHSLGRMSIAWRALVDVLDYPEDIRRHVIGFCWNYSEAKMWLLRVLEALQWPPEVAADYERWREADKALDEELERLLARNSMQSVRAQIENSRPAVALPAWPV
jgi:hypothetical protein